MTHLSRNLDFILLISLILLEITSIIFYVRIIILSATLNDIDDERFADSVFMNILEASLCLFQVNIQLNY